MIAFLTAFGVAFGLSFVGMLPPGMLTMKVIDTSFKQGIKAGLLFGLGAAFVEFFQSLLAIRFSVVIATYLEGNVIVQWVFIALLIMLGIGALLAKPKKKNFDAATEKAHSAFINGMLLSMLNVIVYVFWMGVGAKFMQDGILENTLPMLTTFSFGVFAGSFSVYAIYAKLGHFILNRFEQVAKNINRILAIVFFTLALIQLFKLLA